MRLDLAQVGQAADPVQRADAAVAHLATLTDGHDPESALLLGSVDEASDERAIAVLEHVQRQQQTREEHRPEWEQRQPRHASSLGRGATPGPAALAFLVRS